LFKSFDSSLIFPYLVISIA